MLDDKGVIDDQRGINGAVMDDLQGKMQGVVSDNTISATSRPDLELNDSPAGTSTRIWRLSSGKLPGIVDNLQNGFSSSFPLVNSIVRRNMESIRVV